MSNLNVLNYEKAHIKNNFVHDTFIFFFTLFITIMVQGRVLFGAEFHFFYPTIQKALFKCLSINIVIISEVLEHSFRMFCIMEMANRSPFRCPKILFGPFRWLKSFSVFSRTGWGWGIKVCPCQSVRHILR